MTAESATFLETTRRGMVPEDVFAFNWLSDLALDPGGEVAAYTVKQADAETNGYRAQLYVRELSSGRAQRLSESHGLAAGPAWSPDGQQLAYLWSSAGQHCLRVWSRATAGTAEYPLGDAPLAELAWHPDGRHLAGARWTPMRQPSDPHPRPGVPAPTVRVVRRLRYKQDSVGYVHDRYRQIWVCALETGALTQLTAQECDFSQPSWSLAGDRLAFIGMAREQNQELGQGQIFACGYPGGKPERLLPGWVGACRSPVWGAEDRQIAFAGHQHPVPTNRRIFEQPYLAEVDEGTARALAPQLDQKIGQSLSNVTVKWPADGAWIYFLLTEQAATYLYRIDPQGNYERLVDGDVTVAEYSPAATDRVLYAKGDPTNPGDLYLWAEGVERRLTDLNPWLRDRYVAAPEEYWYEGLDGAKVHAWVMHPPGFEPSQRYPLVLQVHCSLFTLEFNHEFQCLANAGFVVAYFNQRGTTAGYGQAWTRISEGDQGGKDYEEIMLGLDDLLTRSYIDDARMGVTGGSCGGFMTNWIVGHTDRFAAAVTQRSITNYVSFAGTSDFGPEYKDTEENAWENLERAWSQSPIAYAHNVHTPLLILHSDEDHRCALEQAEQLFAALRWMGREVEMVIFEGENHNLSRSGRPGNRVERLRRIQGWFENYLGTEPA